MPLAAPAALPSFPVLAVAVAGVLGLVLVSVSLHLTAASPLKCITIPGRKKNNLSFKDKCHIKYR